MSEFLASFFTDFTTADRLIILAFLFGVFLIGFFIGRVSLWGRLKKLNKELQQQTERLTHVQAEKESLLQTVSSQEESITIQADHLRRAEAQVAQLQQAADTYQKDWQNGQAQIQQLEESHLRYQNQVSALEADQVQSEEVVRQLREQVLLLEAEVAQRTAGETDLDQQRLQIIEDKLSLIEKENQQLQVAIEELQEGTMLRFSQDDIIEVQEDLPGELSGEPEENTTAYTFVSADEKAQIARVALEEHFGQKIALATPEQKDPLQKIEGIGPFIEEQLNHIGIYTFKQISQFDDEIINLVTLAIRFFPGRIKRDNWRGQARELVAN